MSIWKSPIFYLGLLLVGLVVSALSAPFLVNWNNFRSDIDGFATRNLGRNMTSSGPISVKLFPWPRLVVENVNLANAQSFGETPFLTAEKLSIDLALEALIVGQVNVQKLELTRPVLNIQVNAQGSGNWHFSNPVEQTAGARLEQFTLGKITFTDGVLNFQDAKHNWIKSVNTIQGEATSTTLAGPWKLKATGTHGENAEAIPLELTAGLAEVKPNETPQFNFKLSTSDGSWPALIFNGENSAGILKGEALFEPVITEDGRSTLDTNFKPLLYRAKIEAKDDAMTLSGIHIVAADNSDNGTLIEGDGQVKFGKGVQVNLNLNSPRIDLDGLAGTGVARVTDAGGLIGVANTWFATMPKDIDLSAKLDVSSITMAGENLSNLKISVNSSEGGIRLNDLTTDLPGRSRMKFSGILFPGAEQAELAGNLAFESADLRSFAQWLWPESKLVIQQNWSGQRGRIKSTGDVAWTGKHFGFQNLRYELDGLQGQADVAIAFGKTRALNINLSANEFDFGAYVSGGLSNLNLTQVPFALLPDESALDRRVLVQVGKLHLNGVTAENFKIDLNSSPTNMQIKALDFGNVEGAELRGKGNINFVNGGPLGDINFTARAAQPQGLMRLIGLLPASQTPQWAKLFGQTEISVGVNVQPGKSEPQVSYEVNGQSGPYQILGSGDFQNLTSQTSPTWSFSGAIAAPDAQQIFTLIGLSPKVQDASGGRLALTINGSDKKGFETAFDVQAYGANLSYTGNVSPSADLFGVNGILTIQAPQANTLLQTLGLPISPESNSAIKASLNLTAHDKAIKFGAKDIQVGAQTYALDGTINAAKVLDLKVSGGSYKTSDLAKLTLMSTNWLQESFTTFWPFETSGEISFKPVNFTGPLETELHDSSITLSLVDGEKRMKLRALHDGNKVAFDASLTPENGNFTLKAYVNYPIQLASLYGPDAMTGQSQIEGQFTSRGRTVEGVLAQMAGTGFLRSTALQIKGFDAEKFFAAMSGAKILAETEKAASMLNLGEGITLPDGETSFEVEQGILSIEPITAEDDTVIAELATQVDLVSKSMTSTLGLRSKLNQDWPEARIQFTGQPEEMTRRLDYAELARKLGAAFIAQDLANLDKIQEQQKQAELDAAAQQLADQNKYDAFVAQRTEVQLQRRMLKIFTAQRQRDAAYYKSSLARAIAIGIELKQSEIKMLRRRLP